MQTAILVFGALFVQIYCAAVSTDKPVAEKPQNIGTGITLRGAAFKHAKVVLENILKEVAHQGGPAFDIIRVRSATMHHANGKVIKYKTKLIDMKTNKKSHCVVTIWSRPWLKEGSTEVTFECSGTETVVKKLNILT